jgi:single-stranded-DNA-specific exonuclease
MSEDHQKIINTILSKRGIKSAKDRTAFLHPDYTALADPLLLPDMEKACQRLQKAISSKQHIVVYGDYDIDGLSATALLIDALSSMGGDVSAFIPSRFDDGYGLNKPALQKIAHHGAQLVITVDCGSVSLEEAAFAKDIGLDIIITDHHNVGETLPKAIAVINPKRHDHRYPFSDFAGVGVAFQLVRALQSQMGGLENEQEKWLLDLVALGTICDIVSLTGENRILAKWGLEVLKQTRRPGLRALMAVAGIDPEKLTSRSIGFGLGPRLNASGRLETAQLSLDLLTTTNNETAFELAEKLNELNIARRREQNMIFEDAQKQVEHYKDDAVLVVSHTDWSHGVIGIVASKLVEKYKKPTFILQELGDEAKGSARSFGDFSVGDAIRASKQHIIKGGGHHAAAGVTLLTEKINDFRRSVNAYHHTLALKNQNRFLTPQTEVTLDTFESINEVLLDVLSTLEPYGNDNPQPNFYFSELTVIDVRLMGDKKQHIKLTFKDKKGGSLQAIAFSAPDHFFVNSGDIISAYMTLELNEWRGSRTVEGRLVEMKG